MGNLDARLRGHDDLECIIILWTEYQLTLLIVVQPGAGQPEQPRWLVLSLVVLLALRGDHQRVGHATVEAEALGPSLRQC